MDMWAPSPSGEPLKQLHHAATLWAAEVAGPDHLIRAAAEAVAAGLGGIGLARLAGAPSGTIDWNFSDLVREALGEVALDLDDPRSEAARLSALRLLCRQILESGRPAREVARWAHRAIGHGGPQMGEPMVVLDDMYDLADDGFYDRQTMLREALKAAQAVLRGGAPNREGSLRPS